MCDNYQIPLMQGSPGDQLNKPYDESLSFSFKLNLLSLDNQL